MLEILQFYVSGFWIWVGITVGVSVVIHSTVAVIFAIAEMRESR